METDGGQTGSLGDRKMHVRHRTRLRRRRTAGVCEMIEIRIVTRVREQTQRSMEEDLVVCTEQFMIHYIPGPSWPKCLGLVGEEGGGRKPRLS